MLKIDSNLATGVPSWLILSALVLLVARLVFSVSDAIHPPQAATSIKWQGPQLIKSHEPPDGKLVFYYFTANWNEACHELDSKVLSNRDLVSYVNSNFKPVYVVDRALEAKVNTPIVRDLEEHLDASGEFPRLVVTLSNGRHVSTQSGPLSVQNVRRFCEDAQKDGPYFKGYEYLLRDDDAKAAAELKQFRSIAGWDSEFADWGALEEAAALGFLNRKSERAGLLADALANANRLKWPYAIVEYLNHRISFKELEARAGDYTSSLISLHCWAALDDFGEGRFSESATNLNWVLSKADPTTLEYHLCQQAFAKLSSKDAQKQQKQDNAP